MQAKSIGGAGLGMAARKVLVTGADGFIGSHLTEALVRAGHDVRAFVLYNSFNSWGWLDGCAPEIKGQFQVIAGDVRDPQSVADAMRGCDAVLHLAALIAIPYSYHAPSSYVDTNIKGTLHVVQAARDLGVSKVVHTSTSEVYGTAQFVPITEDHPLTAQSPYAASKIGADKLMDSFHRTYGLPVTIVRPFNTYGPHQSARAIVPTILSQALTTGTLRLGSLEPRRDLTYVEDTVAGFIAAAGEERTVGRTIHLGSGHDVSVGEIVEMVSDLIGKPLPVEVDPARIRPPNSEVQRLSSSPALARELMGWEARTPLSEGLARTIDWIERNVHRYRVDEYVV